MIPYLIALGALLAGAFYDYQMTDALYGKLPIFDMIFEKIILFPIEMVVVVTLCLWYRSKRNPLFLIFAMGCASFIYYELVMRFFTLSLIIHCGLAFMLALITVWLICMVLERIHIRQIMKLRPFLTYMTTVLLVSILITTIFKTVWGRIRYRDMQDITQFCVWYKPCGLIGNHSFPSGHTTTMCAILCFLQFKTNVYERVSVWRYLFVIMFIILMQIARMAAGAHFLSDTAMGFIVTYTSYLVITYQFRKRGLL